MTSTNEKLETGYKVAQFISSLNSAFTTTEIQSNFRSTERGLFCTLDSLDRLIAAFEVFDRSQRGVSQAFDSKQASPGVFNSEKSMRRLFGKVNYPLYYLLEGKSALVGALVSCEDRQQRSLGLIPAKGLPLAADTLLHPRDPLFQESWIRSEVTPHGVSYVIDVIDTESLKSSIKLSDSQLINWCQWLLQSNRHQAKLPHGALREAVLVLREVLVSGKNVGSHARFFRLRSDAVTDDGSKKAPANIYYRLADGQVLELGRVESRQVGKQRIEVSVLLDRFPVIRSLSIGLLSKELQTLLLQQFPKAGLEISKGGQKLLAERNAKRKLSTAKDRSKLGQNSRALVANTSKETKGDAKKWVLKKYRGDVCAEVVVDRFRVVTIPLPQLLIFINIFLANSELHKTLARLFTVTDLLSVLARLLESAARVELRHLDPQLFSHRLAPDDGLLRKDGWVFRIGVNDGLLRAIYNEKIRSTNGRHSATVKQRGNGNSPRPGKPSR